MQAKDLGKRKLWIAALVLFADLAPPVFAEDPAPADTNEKSEYSVPVLLGLMCVGYVGQWVNRGLDLAHQKLIK